MSLILIHELGHFITAIIFGWKTDKICLYPYGGVSKLNQQINTSLKEEFFVLIMGPIAEVIFYLIWKELINIRYLNILTAYNNFILCFNLLPIYPLDGGKIVLIILSKITSFKNAFKLTIRISIILEFIIMILSVTVNVYLISVILLLTLLKTKEERNYFKLTFQKFILERIMNNFNFKKTILIDNVNDMKKDNNHLILSNGIYEDERVYLKRKFKT